MMTGRAVELLAAVRCEFDVLNAAVVLPALAGDESAFFQSVNDAVTLPLDTISSWESCDMVSGLPARSSSDSTSNCGSVTEKFSRNSDRSRCSIRVSQDNKRSQVRMASLLRR